MLVFSAFSAGLCCDYGRVWRILCRSSCSGFSIDPDLVGGFCRLVSHGKNEVIFCLSLETIKETSRAAGTFMVTLGKH